MCVRARVCVCVCLSACSDSNTNGHEYYAGCGNGHRHQRENFSSDHPGTRPCVKNLSHKKTIVPCLRSLAWALFPRIFETLPDPYFCWTRSHTRLRRVTCNKFEWQKWPICFAVYTGCFHLSQANDTMCQWALVPVWGRRGRRRRGCWGRRRPGRAAARRRARSPHRRRRAARRAPGPAPPPPCSTQTAISLTIFTCTQEDRSEIHTLVRRGLFLTCTILSFEATTTGQCGSSSQIVLRWNCNFKSKPLTIMTTLRVTYLHFPKSNVNTTFFTIAKRYSIVSTYILSAIVLLTHKVNVIGHESK